VTGITAESAFSGAIKYVSAAVTPTVYALQGHKEFPIENYPTLVSILTGSNNVDIKSTLNLMIDPNIPEDCALLVMVNPADDITPDEKRILSDYLQKGGDLMVLTEFNEHSFPRLNEVLADFNIEITDDKVREDDVDRRFNEQPYTFVADWPAGSLNASSAYNNSLLGVNARHIRILDNAKDWVKVEPLSQTGSSAVIEEKGDATKVSAPGVQVFSALCENTGWMSSNITESSKVIVIGSVNMMSDTVLKSFNTYNGNQFYFSVNWLTDAQDTGLYIAEKPLPSYLLQKGTQTGYIFASVTVLAIIPAILLVVGLVVYRKRKNL
jgi:roadblock/LC7 domain-containing protein